MNIMFQCCQCRRSIRPDRIHSYSKNRNKDFYLCKHFPNVQFRYETKYGFFTLGWRITIKNIYVKCGNCKRWLSFSEKTFKSGITDYNDYIECCDNVVTFSGHENGYYYNGIGFEVQRRINKKKMELKKTIEKLLQEIARLEREEKLRKEREEKLRREREEKRRREREKMNRMMKEQEEESENLDKVINFDMNWMENEMMEVITNAEMTFSDNINYNVKADIEKNFKYQISKTKF